MANLEKADLSTRERQLLKLAAAGLTDSAIAHRLDISEATVSTYWRRIRKKIGPYSRTEIVASLLKTECEKVISGLVSENERLTQQLEKASRTPSPGSFYRQLLEGAADAIVVVDVSGKIEVVNDSAAILFGWTEGELVGTHISSLIPSRYHAAHRSHVGNYLDAPKKRPMGVHFATPALHRDGHEMPIAANLSVVGEGADRKVICMIRSLDLA